MGKKSNVLSFLIILLISLMSSIIIWVFLTHFYAENQYRLLSSLTQKFISEHPDKEQDIIRYIKESNVLLKESKIQEENYLSTYGFKPKDFSLPHRNLVTLSVGFCILLFFSLLLFLLHMIRRSCRQRIWDLTGYLEKANLDSEVTIMPNIEDDFSQLQDEIYKTVTELSIAKEIAIKEKKNFADNLANIAHQIKTPVTSISIMSQLCEQELTEEYIKQIKKQTVRLQQLVDALLTLSRIDAGVLKLRNEQVDVYSMLELSVEAVDEIIREKEIKISLPNHLEITFEGDMEWSIEAFINIIKNCVEHMTHGGELLLDYTRNPLYTEIIIKDNGKGFSEKEISHIFERFYQGEKALKTGVGIGLSLTKSIIEMQRGFITAKNLPEGGASFIVRFYSH